MKAVQLMVLVGAILLLGATPALAQTPPTSPGVSALSGPSFGAGLGAGITLIGAGIGFGRIGASAMEGMARQPEITNRIQTGMIVIAALLEGATFFALVVCIIVAGKAVTGSPF
jgi:F-type H+-transporting ATPase subunit c